MRYLPSILFTIIPCLAADWYAAANGLSTNSGAINSPWALQTAFCGGNGTNLCSNPAGSSQIQPGDTLWLRGGTYGTGGSFTYKAVLDGTSQNPIRIRQYPNERVIINGGINTEGTGGGGPIRGSYLWFWGFEITNTSTYRLGDPANRAAGLELNSHGIGNKAINLIIHDVGHPGIGFWSQSTGGEINGCILYYNGLTDTVTFGQPTYRGSAIYGQNETGIVNVKKVISFSNYTTGMKAYSTNVDTIGWRFNDVISFNNQDEEDIFVGTNNEYADDIQIVNNNTFQNYAINSYGGQGGVQVGYASDNGTVLVDGNYIIGGGRGGLGALTVLNWTSPTITNNTIGSPSNLAYILAAPAGPWGTWSTNSYYGGTGAANNKPFRRDSGSATYYTFAEWQGLGHDVDSTRSSTLPTTNYVKVIPNDYEPGNRAYIAIYNWELTNTVTVNLTAANLIENNIYLVKDVQNYFGSNLLSFTYHAASPNVIIPTNHSTSSAISTPIGNLVYAPQHTVKQFLALVIIKASIDVPTDLDANVKQTGGLHFGGTIR